MFIDTLARTPVGGDENSAGDTGAFLATVDTIRSESGCTVLVVHQSDKDKGDERGVPVYAGPLT